MRLLQKLVIFEVIRLLNDWRPRYDCVGRRTRPSFDTFRRNVFGSFPINMYTINDYNYNLQLPLTCLAFLCDVLHVLHIHDLQMMCSRWCRDRRLQWQYRVVSGVCVGPVVAVHCTCVTGRITGRVTRSAHPGANVSYHVPGGTSIIHYVTTTDSMRSRQMKI